jgi:hypothetical protein
MLQAYIRDPEMLMVCFNDKSLDVCFFLCEYNARVLSGWCENMLSQNENSQVRLTYSWHNAVDYYFKSIICMYYRWCVC